MVVVMIASEKDSIDLDAREQTRQSELDQLLVRNGKPATINDNTDFADILRRRLFESNPPAEVVTATAQVFYAVDGRPVAYEGLRRARRTLAARMGQTR